jgi:hypothetical protein
MVLGVICCRLMGRAVGILVDDVIRRSGETMIPTARSTKTSRDASAYWAIKSCAFWTTCRLLNLYNRRTGVNANITSNAKAIIFFGLVVRLVRLWLPASRDAAAEVSPMCRERHPENFPMVPKVRFVVVSVLLVECPLVSFEIDCVVGSMLGVGLA